MNWLMALWAVSAATVLIASGAWLGPIIIRGMRGRLLDALAQVDAAQTEAKRALEELRARGTYLESRVARGIGDRLATERRRVSGPAPRLLTWMSSHAIRERVAGATRRHDQLVEELSRFNDEHVSTEMRQHYKLLAEDEGLNDEQQRAAVRDDAVNLVIAAAGSGKTRTLLARVRYLTQRRDRVDPKRILVVTYTKAVAGELQEKLARKGLGEVTASTLHSLGNRIISKTRGRAPLVFGEARLNELAEAMLADAFTGRDPEFATLVREALVNYYRGETEDESPPLPAARYRTLRGERVKSTGERRIADYLFLHGVDYQYEAVAKWAPRDSNRKPYQPDFHLTDYDVYIEHWGVDERGNVPSAWLRTTEQYQAKMTWARNVFQSHDRALVETFDYERRRGTLEAALSQRLARHGVTFRPLTLDELKQSVYAFRRIEEQFARSLVGWITNARALRLRAADVPARLQGYPPRVRTFGACAAPVLKKYEEALRKEDAIDYSDMLHEAAEALEADKAGAEFRFEHVLVDEFQDLSSDKARLVRALVKTGPAKLFAVGDDWQSIFAFAGGDVSFIVDFEKHFGQGARSLLTTNFRCPSRIVEAGGVLIANNERQVKKAVRAAKASIRDPLVHTVADDNATVWEKTAEIIHRELDAGRKPEDILVLSRVNWPLAEVRSMLHRRRIHRDAVASVRLLSAHSAKGLEAPVVIVMDVTDDLYGFPCQIEGSDLLAPVRLSRETEEAEERRLLYVALTRATDQLHIVTREGRPSRFLLEIEGGEQAISPDEIMHKEGERIDAILTVDRLLPLTEAQARTRMAQKGHLRSGSTRIVFSSWHSSDPPHVEAGHTYRFQGLKVKSYNGKAEVVLDGETIATMEAASETKGGYENARPLRVKSQT